MVQPTVVASGASPVALPRPPAVLHLASLAGPRSLGVGSVIRGLLAAQRTLGAETAAWSNDTEAEGEVVRREESLPPRSFVTHPVVGPSRLSYSPSLAGALAREGGRFDVLHQHGIWTACSWAALAWRRRFGRPTVIAPHGSLAPWALRRSRLRKWGARLVYEGRNLAGTACLHAVAEPEVADCRGFGLRNPVAVIPNAVSDDWLDWRGDGESFRACFGLPRDRRLLLFLSRVTPIKGLPLLLEALAGLRERLTDWLLVVAGPDEFDHLREVKGRAEALGLGPWVRFLGPVYGPDRRAAFAAAEVFVLPTRKEARPMVVLEALGAGAPVLTTRGANCDDLLAHGCGWVSENTADSLREALRDALAGSPDAHAAMGGAGRAVVRARHTWAESARKTFALYRWLRGEESRPSFVVCD